MKCIIVIIVTITFAFCTSSTTISRSALHKFMDLEELQYYFGTDLENELPDYEIVDLPEGLDFGRESVTTNGGEDDLKYVNFKVFNKQIELNLYPNKVLVSPYTKIAYKNGNLSVNEYFASSAPKYCHYLHKNSHSTAAISNCEPSEIHGLIFLPDDSLEILPLTGRLKGLMPEYKFLDDTRTVTITKIPHLVKRSVFTLGTFDNDFVNPTFRHLPVNYKNYRNDRGLSYERPTIELGLFFDEAFFNIFSPFFENDNKKLEDFILSYVNGMQSLYHHHTLGRNIDFTIVYLEIMKKQPINMPHAYGERNELIDNFCEYQKKINPKDDRNPQHWDMSVYVSGLDFFAWDPNGFKNGATMGLATVGGVCQEDFNCIIAEFGTNNQFGKPYPSAGYTSVYILAHEIGHNLGMSHDATGNSCNRDGYVMSPSRGTLGETTWSSCSASIVKKLDWAKCLFDKPSLEPSKYDAWKFNGYPGLTYTAKDQCEILLRDRDAYPFFNNQESSICENLHCRTPNRAGFFFAGPALQGTSCGKGTWCEGGSCVTRKVHSITSTTTTTTSKPTTTAISTKKPTYSIPLKEKCKSHCIKHSKGTQIIQRNCASGQNCGDSSINVEICDDRSVCSTRKTVIEYGTQKCKEFSRKLNNIDSTGLGLQARYDSLRLWMPCAVFCKHRNNTSYFTPRVELNELRIDPYFPDGTWCNREGNVDFYCLQHHCLPENTKLSKTPSYPTTNDELPAEAFLFRFDDTGEDEMNMKFVTFRP